MSGLVLILLSALSGCSSISVHEKPAASASYPEPNLILMPPNLGPEPQLLKQTVTLSRHGHQIQFISVNRLTSEKIELLALLPVGQPLMELSYDGQKLSNRVYGKLPINGPNILALLQFSLWPKRSVEQYYSPEMGWALHINQTKRLLSWAGERWLKVNILPNGLIVDNYRENYQVQIHTVEKMDL